ncbi:estradiol 17-beta-dehydrogenase 8-like, partial [Pipra filicauda]|uniref:Estradiol 17-beta-dehydrogenase 8-like n=1 Tax=Pipra filicauda TaxID=649802 RepID=A0A7R5KC44_9PASS
VSVAVGGTVVVQEPVSVAVGGTVVVQEPVGQLRGVWEATSFSLERLQANPELVAQEEQDLGQRWGPSYQLTFDPCEEPPLLRHMGTWGGTLGTFLVTQEVTKALVTSGDPGGASLVLVGSVVAKVGNLGQTNYGASKGGVEGLTRSVAKEVARFGIRCNSVLPGFIVTPMTDKVPPKVLDKFAGMVPLGRLGDPEDVADVVAFLASGDSGYVTGATLEVTGGLFM